MTITTKQITVYVDDLETEHPTLEAAAQANARHKLWTILDDQAAYGEIQVSDAVDCIMKHWDEIRGIMLEALAATPEDVDTVTHAFPRHKGAKLQKAIPVIGKVGKKPAPRACPDGCECGDCWQAMEGNGGKA